MSVSNCGAKTSPGWVLQQSGDVVGPRRLLITARAIRIDSIKGGYSIVSRAPNWAVTIYNRRSNKFIQMPHEAFRGDTTAKLYSGDKTGLSKGIWKKAVAEKICGQNTWRFEMIPTKISLSEGNRIAHAQYNILRDAPVSPEAFGIIRLIYQLPSIVGVPMRLAFVDMEDNYTVHPVETSQIKSEQLQESEFDLPPGMNRTKDQMEVFVDPLSKQVYDGFTGWTAPNLNKPKRESERR